MLVSRGDSRDVARPARLQTAEDIFYVMGEPVPVVWQRDPAYVRIMRQMHRAAGFL